jgi:hypothetical protein
MATPQPTSCAVHTGYHPYLSNAEWNCALPANAPVWAHWDPPGSEIGLLDEIKDLDPNDPDGFSATDTYPKLTCCTDWAIPIVVSAATDNVFTIQQSMLAECAFTGIDITVPIHIPDTVSPPPNPLNTDHPVVVLDPTSGYGTWMWRAVKTGSGASAVWSACTASQSLLTSNGLDNSADFGDPANMGHRGAPAGGAAIRYDEVAQGHVDHMLQLVLNETVGDSFASHCQDAHHAHTDGWFWPMVNNESRHTGDWGCEGLVLRIKTTVDLAGRGLSGGCLTVARAWQTYGGMVRDTGGTNMTIEMENVVQTGKPAWSTQGITNNCFSGRIGWNDLEAIDGGYDRPPTGS